MQKKKFNQNLMTAKEVSEFMRIPQSTVYYLAQEGRIKGVKVGKHWRFIEEDILRYLNIKKMLTSESAILIKENRLHPRLNTKISAKLAIAFNDEKGDEQEGMISNLSEGGLFFTGSDIQLQVGDPVRIKFEVTGSHPCKLNVEGRIVHKQSNSKIGVGIKFRNINPADQGVICHYVG